MADGSPPGKLAPKRRGLQHAARPSAAIEAPSNPGRLTNAARAAYRGRSREEVPTMIETDTRARTQTHDSAKSTVLNPTGYPPRVTPKDMAPRLDTLEGNKPYLLTSPFNDPDSFLPPMQTCSADHL